MYFVELDDVGMVQHLHDLDLAVELVLQVVLENQVLLDHLQRHQLLREDVLGDLHLPQPPEPDRPSYHADDPTLLPTLYVEM